MVDKCQPTPVGVWRRDPDALITCRASDSPEWKKKSQAPFPVVVVRHAGSATVVAVTADPDSNVSVPNAHLKFLKSARTSYRPKPMASP